MCLHCPKNNLNLGIKTKPVTVGKDATVYVWFLHQIYSYELKNYTIIYRCIRFGRDRLGFNAEFRLFLVQGGHLIRKNKVLTKSGLKPCQPPHPHPAVPDPNHPPYIPPPSRQYNSTDRHVLQGWGGLKGGGVKKIGLIITEEGGRAEGE